MPARRRLSLSTRTMLALAILAGTLLAPAGAQAQHRVFMPPPERRDAAPQFPLKFEWLNNKEPLAFNGNLKGHVVVLDFWTYCCINCIHILPHLEYLEHKYADKPVVVIGVHSAKFETEKKAKNIEQAIARYRIAHPVIVDQDFALMNAFRPWGVGGWPSFVVIDTNGKVAGSLGGERVRDSLDGYIKALLEEGKQKGTLAKKKVKLTPTIKAPGPEGLSFPGKIHIDPATKRLFIADSNNDRILIADTTGKVSQIIGSGKPGFKDGSLTEAQFKNPQGMDVVGNVIYLTDTDNHRLRKIDLDAKTVTTLAGNGQRGFDTLGGLKGKEQPIASPWDVVHHKGNLLIAMAGPHQLWTHELKSGLTRAWVGSGREHILDGPARFAALAQPSGMVVLDGWAYFTDTEGSAIRRAALDDGRVETLVGAEGTRGALFDFGYKDGQFPAAKFQHAIGIALLGKNLVIADTYNSQIRLMDLSKKTVSTLYGGEDKLDEPTGLDVLDGKIYIADTNNHRILVLDPATKKAEPLKITLPKN